MVPIKVTEIWAAVAMIFALLIILYDLLDQAPLL